MYVLLILLVSIYYSLVDGFGLHGFTFKGLDEPQILGTRTKDVHEDWLIQPLDHFNSRDNNLWHMRYYKNAAFSTQTGPILIMLGGEWEIEPNFLTNGLMYDIAVAHGAMMYYTEHRYYGKSKPIQNISEENLQYLNVDQALADIAYFIEKMKQNLGKENAKVIVFGGSYAGNMAVWARLKYPHLIQGAVASSAPIYAKADFYEYNEIVARSLRSYDEQCPIDIKAAFDSVKELLTGNGGAEKLKTYFNLCKVPNVKSNNDVSHLINIFIEKFAGIVQYNKNQDSNKSDISVCCDNMTATYLGSPLQRLARLLSKDDGSCLDASYEQFISRHRNISWSSDSIIRRWYYQTCTEYGYYSTTDSKDSIFGSLVPLDYFLNICVNLYGNYYDGNFLKLRIERTNLIYGGYKPDITHVIFTNGDLDPWHKLSVLLDLNESTPAILIKGASHCQDLMNDLPTDLPDLREARKTVRNIIAKWITS
ncbi:thymus-specific serine protease-like [Vespa mandarinia]|uniref:thymus-specific serine protease-like n=1 Tax=Vespa mandarinia TaxID=7446 RepID=UPI0016142651|nr:thymus-specific serine protease-like [Vespa mandarinia]